MLTALQTLIDNGCSYNLIESILNDVIANIENDGDKRRCIAMLFDYEQGNKNDPDEYSILYGIVNAPGAEYLILDDNEADAACEEYIKETVWAFCPSFLSGETGINETVFEALTDKCEDANDAIRSIIDGTCGIDSFIDSAISADGRGHFLNHYDSEEHEVSVGSETYYLYRVN